MLTQILWFITWPLLILVSWLAVNALIKRTDPAGKEE